MKIAIIGDGGWGTANAILLSGYGHETVLWGAFPDYIEEMRSTRRNDRYLKGVALPDTLKLESDRAKAVEGADIVVLAPPSAYFAAVAAGFKGLFPHETPVVSLTKGICENTRKTMSALAEEILGVENVTVLAGPTHAEEVSRGIPTAIVAACADPKRAKYIQKIWSGPRFRVYTSTDVTGIQVGGAVKNVIAIAVGASDGLGFGDNTRAALITRGLAEMKRFVTAFGGRPETLSGLAGVGDLIVTCTSRHSRNHYVGEELGKGRDIGEILASMKMVAEGVGNSKAVCAIARELGVEMPICETVRALCAGEISAKDAAAAMMGRTPKPEEC